MRWEDERYVRLYTRDTATWKLLSWQGRALLPLLLRKADRLGLVDLEGDSVEGVAALVDIPPEVVAPGLTGPNGLLARGVVVEVPGGLAFPRYTEAQEARASDRLRAQDYRARKAITHRDEASRTVTDRHDSSHGVTRRHPASHGVTPSLAFSEVSSNEETVPSALTGSADPDPKSILGETTEGQRQTDEKAPGEAPDAQPAGVVAPKPSAGTVEPPALSLTLDEPARGKRRTAKPEAPPPFGIGEAFEALASSALGRFSAGTPRDWTKGHRIAVAKVIRAYPTLDEWSVLGAWLAAGGDRYRGTLSVAWAASSALPDAMARARDWHAQGRPVLDGHRQHSAPQAPPAPTYTPPKPTPLPPLTEEERERAAAMARKLGPEMKARFAEIAEEKRRLYGTR